jgi:hypothetical protein
MQVDNKWTMQVDKWMRSLAPCIDLAPPSVYPLGDVTVAESRVDSPSPSSGYAWTGRLDETDVQSLYAACQSLRFTGRLELTDGPRRVQVFFVGGEPVDIDGGDTDVIQLWRSGTFRAVQSIPNPPGSSPARSSSRGRSRRPRPRRSGPGSASIG